MAPPFARARFVLTTMCAMQVWQDRKLEHLALPNLSPPYFEMQSVGLVSSTLTTLTCEIDPESPWHPQYISQMLPTPTPLHTFHLEGTITLDDAQDIIDLLAENAPQLCYLMLVSTLEQETQTEQAIQLSMLTNLRLLFLSGRPLVDAFALLLASTPAAATMPTLKELHLPDAYLPLEPLSLAALTQLTHLELGAHCCHVTRAGGLCDESYLPAIKQMSSLAVLALGAPKLSVTEREVREMVLPPSSLQSLDLNDPTAESKAVVLRVLGHYIKHITC